MSIPYALGFGDASSSFISESSSNGHEQEWQEAAEEEKATWFHDACLNGDSEGQALTQNSRPNGQPLGHFPLGIHFGGRVKHYDSNSGALASGSDSHGRGQEYSKQDAPALPTLVDDSLGSPRPDESLERSVNQAVGESEENRPGGSIGQNEKSKRVLRLSPEKMYELASSPKSLPLHVPGVDKDPAAPASTPALINLREKPRTDNALAYRSEDRESRRVSPSLMSPRDPTPTRRPSVMPRTTSSPALRKLSSSQIGSTSHSMKPRSNIPRSAPPPLDLEDKKAVNQHRDVSESLPSPMPPSIPMPPLSIPTYLQLELSSHRPSSLYIHRSATSDFPYESSRVKIERLMNFLLLPPQLEQVLWFGALACLDAWLYSFTILPLRFLKALYILTQSWGRNLSDEVNFVVSFIYAGAGRMWQRRQSKDHREDGRRLHPIEIAKENPASEPLRRPSQSTDFSPREESSPVHLKNNPSRRHRQDASKHHRRTKSAPSALMPEDKADILQGLLIIISCSILMYFDASRMYHSIRGQAAIKLYVIYNVLEVCDRLFSALGQDVLECLFSKEALERKPDGRSKVLRPFWLFILALLYNLVHATALFYQVITLNVAVNSYSNALLTLLMSNQFVEIKSTVFKKFEKENLFQLTCADVVERFQLWLMLTIIASRNVVETSGLGLSSGSISSPDAPSTTGTPLKTSGILPNSFTLLPDWPGQVMSPFFLVLGSEMLVDWIKHAYITKFNNTKPNIYGRFLDVLAKDYYSNAFADQNLTRRLGLPVIPLSCLFIRASVQTYHMFLATNMPPPIHSPATSLAVSASSSPTPSLHTFDSLFRRALGSTMNNATPSSSLGGFLPWAVDDIIAALTMLVFFLVLFLLLLACKLLLGMCLLSFARSRYKGMKEREGQSTHAQGRRVGGWGVVEVDDEKRRWVYGEDEEGLRKARQKEREGREKEKGGGGESYGGVSRYSMVAKRIW